MEKKKIYEACCIMQDELIDNIRFAMNEAQSSANEYGQPKDRYDSYRTQLLRKRDLFAKQLHQALEKKEILKKIDPSIKHDRVGFGAAVDTGSQKMYISISLGKVKVENETWYAISPQVPIYDSIKNLREGDTFSFRGQSGKVLNVY